MSDYQKELTDLSEDIADSFEELSDALVKAGKLLAEQAETFNVTMARAAEPFIRVMEAAAANLPGWDAGPEGWSFTHQPEILTRDEAFKGIYKRKKKGPKT